jgi:hypothetical protein
MKTVGAAAQHHRVAGLETQRAGVGADIGPALEDHGDDAERHAHAFDGHAVGALPAFGDGADRIGNIAHGADAVGHRGDAGFGQRQPIDEGGCRAASARFGNVLGIGLEDRCRISADRPLHCIERTILLLGRRQRQLPRGGAGAGGEVGHLCSQIGVAVDGFEGHAHW